MEEVSNLFGNEDIVVILKKLLDPLDIELKTGLTKEGIRALAKTKFISERNKPENNELNSITVIMDKVIPYILRLKVSENRKGRAEIVDAIKFLNKDLIGDKDNSLFGNLKK